MLAGGTGESFEDLEVRATRVLKMINEEYTDMVIVIVSHVDPLQMFWAICKGVPLKERFFSDLKHFKNCEVREFKYE